MSKRERPSHYEIFNTAPFREIAHNQADAVGVLTRWTHARATGLSFKIQFGSPRINPANPAHITALRDISTMVAENVPPGGRAMDEISVNALYSAMGNHTFSQLTDLMAGQMAGRLQRTMAIMPMVSNGGVFLAEEISSSRNALDIMFDMMDLIKLDPAEKRQPGMRIIAESLRRRGVSAQEIGFALYEMSHVRFETADGARNIDPRELRTDPPSAGALKEAYLYGASEKEAAGLERGEIIAQQARARHNHGHSLS